MKNVLFLILIYKITKIWSGCEVENKNSTAISGFITTKVGSIPRNEETFKIPYIIAVKNSDENLDIYIIHLVGAGSSARVFKGKNLITNETHALKIYSEKFKYGLKYEKEIYEELNSEYIPAIYGAGSCLNSEVLILEYFEDTLYNFFIKYKTTYSEKIIIIKNIIFALRSIHDNRIIHNDLKADNIFITEDFKIKIFDFGLSCTEDDLYFFLQDCCPNEIDLYPHISPELKNSIEYTTKSDIWSLGCLIESIFEGLKPDSSLSLIDLEFLSKTIKACLSKDFVQRPSAKSLSYNSIFDNMYAFLDILRNDGFVEKIFSSFMSLVKNTNEITFRCNEKSIYLYYIKSLSNQNIINEKLFEYLNDDTFLNSVKNYKHIFLSHYRYFFISKDNYNLFSIMDLDNKTLNMVKKICDSCDLFLNEAILYEFVFQELYQNIQKLENNKIFKIAKTELQKK